MCFSSTISLSTAIIEFILATILLLFVKKSPARNFFIVIIYLLGFYQLTEFMLCSSTNPHLWAIIGFITYIFLPAIALHGVLKFLNKKANLFLIYIIPVLASLIAIFTPGFIISASCDKVFVNVDTIINFSSSLLINALSWVYLAYYPGFILLASLILYRNYLKQRNKIRRGIEIAWMLGVLLATLPALIFILIFPTLGKTFPSVLCGFALLTAITAFIAVYLEGKLNKGKERKKKK